MFFPFVCFLLTIKKKSHSLLFNLLFSPPLNFRAHKLKKEKKDWRKENGIRTGRDHIYTYGERQRDGWGERWCESVQLRKQMNIRKGRVLWKVGGGPQGSWQGQQLIRMRGRSAALMQTVSGAQTKACRSPQRRAQCALISGEEDEEEEQNETFGLFNVTSVQANFSDVLWMRYSLSLFSSFFPPFSNRF